MQIVWTVTLETDTPGPPAALSEAVEGVRVWIEDVALIGLGHLLGDDGSCEATVKVDP